MAPATMFLGTPLAPLTAIDFALAAAIAVALPLYAFAENQRDKHSEAVGRARPLLDSYRNSMAILSGLTLLVAMTWLGAGRALSALGLGADFSWSFLAACALALAASALYGVQILAVRRSASARAQLADLLKSQAGVRSVLPQSETEMRSFRWLALTASVTEEVLFRGFLIWVFAHWMHPCAAAGCSLAAFTLAHLYQENTRALAGVMIAGAATSALVLIGGSLFPAMLVHAAVDLAGGEMAWLARKEIAAAGDAVDGR